jgi:hypothetical protein
MQEMTILTFYTIKKSCNSQIKKSKVLTDTQPSPHHMELTIAQKSWEQLTIAQKSTWKITFFREMH